jgi:hypothetical protein
MGISFHGGEGGVCNFMSFWQIKSRCLSTVASYFMQSLRKYVELLDALDRVINRDADFFRVWLLD